MTKTVTEIAPAQDRQKRLTKRAFVVGDFNELSNPIADQITDGEEIKKLFKHYPYIPYSGSSFQSRDELLNLLNLLTASSPTLGACIGNIKNYVFAGPIKIGRFNGDDYEALEDETLSKRYFEFINKIDINSDAVKNPIKGFLKSIYDNHKKTGNQFLAIYLSETGGTKDARIIRNEPQYCRYLATSVDEPKQVAVSLKWDYTYVKQNPPETIPIYPYYTEVDGVKKTMVHVKNGNYPWYGRPDWMPSWLAAFSEYQNKIYVIKESRNDFRPRTIIEFEDGEDENFFNDATDDKSANEAGYDSAVQRWQANTTMSEGDPQMSIVTNRPAGARRFHAHEFKSNTSHEFYTAINNENERDIIRANNWSKKLMDGDTAGSLAGGSGFMDDVASKELSVLPDLRFDCLCGLNTAYSVIAEFLGETEFIDLGLTIESKFKTINDELDNSNRSGDS